jgi:hypothetical protein
VLRKARPALSKATKSLPRESSTTRRAKVGFATVVRASLDKPALAKTLNLRPPQKIIWGNGSGTQRSRQALLTGYLAGGIAGAKYTLRAAIGIQSEKEYLKERAPDYQIAVTVNPLLSGRETNSRLCFSFGTATI